MGHHFRAQVRFSPYQYLKLTNSNLLKAFAKFTVLLPVALLFLPGIAKTGECFAAPVRHHLQTKETTQTPNSRLANASGAVTPVPPERQQPVPVSIIPVKEDLVSFVSKGIVQGMMTTVYVGSFEPARIAKPSRQSFSRGVKTEVFAARNIVSTRSSATGREKPARVGSFDLASDAWAGNGKETAPAEDGASSESGNGSDTSGTSIQ